MAIDIAWNQYILVRVAHHPQKILWEYMLRTVLVFITCKCEVSRVNRPKSTKNVFYSIFSVLLAVAIPQLDLFISLIGKILNIFTSCSEKIN